MKAPTEAIALQGVTQRLSALLELPSEAILATEEPQVQDQRTDLLLQAGPHLFLIEWKGAGSAAAIAKAIEVLQKGAAHLDSSVILLVGVTFMGKIGRRLCRDAHVCWLDLSGNAWIVAPGLRIQIDGQPNRYRPHGRPASAFAAKSARIARWLLIRASESMSQRELARATEMDEGFTSRIVRRLEEDDLIVRNDAGAISVRDPNLLLDAWQESYAFSQHNILRGHIATRSGEDLLRRLGEKLTECGVEHAATGLAAAWLMTHFAAFRTVTFYLHQPPRPELLRELGLREEPRGANVWLVTPKDAGVFHGAERFERIRAVHPVQAYLDLGGHPERAAEAATHLRSQLLHWERR